MMFKCFLFIAALLAVGNAHPTGLLAPIIGTHATSYNAHTINHAYGIPAAIAAPAPAYSLYSYPGLYNQLIAARR